MVLQLHARAALFVAGLPGAALPRLLGPVSSPEMSKYQRQRDFAQSLRVYMYMYMYYVYVHVYVYVCVCMCKCLCMCTYM